jgi:hypothetical protein
LGKQFCSANSTNFAEFLDQKRNTSFLVNRTEFFFQFIKLKTNCHELLYGEFSEPITCNLYSKYVFFDQKILRKQFSSANSTNFAEFLDKKRNTSFLVNSTEFFNF